MVSYAVCLSLFLQKTFIARNELAHTLLNTDGDHWRFLRNTLLPTFSSGKMRMVGYDISRDVQFTWMA